MREFNDLSVDEMCDACILKKALRTSTRNKPILDLILPIPITIFIKTLLHYKAVSIEQD